MDGIVFLPNTVEVFIHQELAVQKQQPELLDLSVSPNIAELALVIVKCIILNSRTLTNDLSLNFYFPRLCMYSTYRVCPQCHLIGKATTTCVCYLPTWRVDRLLIIPIPHLRMVGASTPAVSTVAQSPMVVVQLPFQVTVVVVVAAVKTRNSKSMWWLRCNRRLKFPLQCPRCPQVMLAAAAAAVAAESPVSVLLCHDIDLTDFQSKAGRALFEMRCQISINGQDFSSVKHSLASANRPLRSQGGDGGFGDNGSVGGVGGFAAAGVDIAPPPCTLVYAFTPESIRPSCFSLDRLHSISLLQSAAAADDHSHQSQGSNHSQSHNNGASEDSVEWVVKGSSFLPAARLPKGAQVFVSFTPQLDKIVWNSNADETIRANGAGVTTAQLPAAQFPVRCDSTNSLTIAFGKDSLVQLAYLVTVLNDIGSGIETAAGGEDAQGFDGAEHAKVLVIDLLPLKLEFSLQLGEVRSPLNSNAADGTALVLNVYKNLPVQIVPNCCNLMHAADNLQYSLLVNRAVTAADKQASTATVCADGFPLHCPDAVVAIHLPITEGGTDANGTEVRCHPPIMIPKVDVTFTALSSLASTPAITAAGEDESAETTVQEHEVESAVPSAPSFLVQFSLHPLQHYTKQVGGSVGSADHGAGELQYLFVSCWLDGKSAPPQEKWTKLYYYRTLTHNYIVNPPAPKIGFVSGNAISLELSSYCPPIPALAVHIPVPEPPSLNHDLHTQHAHSEHSHSEHSHSGEAAVAVEGAQQPHRPLAVTISEFGSAPESVEHAPSVVKPQCCVVRIRGAPTEQHPDGVVMDAPALLADSPQGQHSANPTFISFDIPEGVRSLEGMVPVQKTPKDKTLFYVDISVDGGVTFDKAEAPLLFLK